MQLLYSPALHRLELAANSHVRTRRLAGSGTKMAQEAEQAAQYVLNRFAAICLQAVCVSAHGLAGCTLHTMLTWPACLHLLCRDQQQDTEAEEVEDFQSIDKLQQLGINAGMGATPAVLLCLCCHTEIVSCQLCAPASAGDIKKAKEGGVHTCEALLMRTRKVKAQCSWLDSPCYKFKVY